MDNTVHSNNFALPNISDRHQTKSKHFQYSDQEAERNHDFAPEINADQNRRAEQEHSMNSTTESTKQQNSRQCFEQYMKLKTTEKQCSEKTVQINKRTKIKRHETCVTVKRKRKRTPNNRLRGKGDGYSNCSPSSRVPLKMGMSKTRLNRSNPIISFLNKISSDPKLTNISDTNRSSLNISKRGTLNISTGTHKDKAVTQTSFENNESSHEHKKRFFKTSSVFESVINKMFYIIREARAGFKEIVSNQSYALPSLVDIITQGDFSTAEKMLLCGTNDINKQDKFGHTPLIACCIYTHETSCKSEQCLKIMKLLLKQASCGVNLRNNYGRNALMLACLFALPEHAELLLNDSRCDPCMQDADGHTALIICCYEESSPSRRENKIRIVRMLLKHENSGIDVSNHSGQSALVYACNHALSELVELLLNHSKCDPCQQDLDGRTVLIVCCMVAGKTNLVEYVRVVRMLLKKHNCGISICDKDGRNALMYACYFALPEIVELLLSHIKCDPCQQDVNGDTPLIVCCRLAKEQ